MSGPPVAVGHWRSPPVGSKFCSTPSPISAPAGGSSPPVLESPGSLLLPVNPESPAELEGEGVALRG